MNRSWASWRGMLFLMTVALLLQPTFSVRAANRDGFLGVPWGSSGTTLEKLMEDNGFVKMDNTGYGNCRYFRGKAAGDEYVWFFILKDSKVQAVATAFLGTDEAVQERYEHLRFWLSREYGQPVRSLAGDDRAKHGYPGEACRWTVEACQPGSGRIDIKLEITKALANPYAKIELFARNLGE